MYDILFHSLLIKSLNKEISVNLYSFSFYINEIPLIFDLLFIPCCRIIDHCIKKRLPWTTCFARKVCKEGEYYEDMMRYLRRNLAVC